MSRLGGGFLVAKAPAGVWASGGGRGFSLQWGQSRVTSNSEGGSSPTRRRTAFFFGDLGSS